MATYFALDLINRALRLLGVLAEGETPSASESIDTLMALNQMIDSWSNENLMVFMTTKYPYVWPAGQASTGTSFGFHPTAIDESTYYVDATGLSHPVRFITEAEYNAIPFKETTGSYPQVMWVNPTYPDPTVTIYPVPDQELTWQFVVPTPLQELNDPSTELFLPLGYVRAFTYNLACEIAPEFGVEPSRQVQRIATISKRNLKRINSPADVLAMPSELVGRGRYNIYGG